MSMKPKKNMHYISPLTKKPQKPYKKYTIAGKIVPDFRDLGFGTKFFDEYNDGDPYPKDELREKRISKWVKSIILHLAPDLNKRPCFVLDAACGTGDWIYYVQKYSLKRHRICVAENSRIALEKCLKRNPGIESACLFDANFLPFERNSFDVILAVNIFEHIKAPVFFLEQAIQCLKPDGTILVSTPSRYRFANVILALSGKKLRLIHKQHITEYTIGQVKEMVAAAGGKVEAVTGTVLAAPGSKLYPLRYFIKFIQFIISRLVRSHHLMHMTVFFQIKRQ